MNMEEYWNTKPEPGARLKVPKIGDTYFSPNGNGWMCCLLVMDSPRWVRARKEAEKDVYMRDGDGREFNASEALRKHDAEMIEGPAKPEAEDGLRGEPEARRLAHDEWREKMMREVEDAAELERKKVEKLIRAHDERASKMLEEAWAKSKATDSGDFTHPAADEWEPVATNSSDLNWHHERPVWPDYISLWEERGKKAVEELARLARKGAG